MMIPKTNRFNLTTFSTIHKDKISVKVRQLLCTKQKRKYQALLILKSYMPNIKPKNYLPNLLIINFSSHDQSMYKILVTQHNISTKIKLLFKIRWTRTNIGPRHIVASRASCKPIHIVCFQFYKLNFRHCAENFLLFFFFQFFCQELSRVSGESKVYDRIIS